MPARLASFRVTEGTWLSLDVSPDGLEIVFDLLGDLYALPIAGGTARQLTSGMALNRQPRYSPNGQQLVFVSDRSGRENLWISDRDGLNARQVSDLRGYDPIGAVTSPTWSSDGRSIYASQRFGAVRPGIGFDDPRHPMWMLAAYDVESRQMRWLSDTPPAHARSMLGASVDPRGHALYVAFHPSPPSSSLGFWRIGRLDLATGQLFPEMGGNVGRIGTRPVVSPNGKWLVYGSASGSHLGFRLRDLTTAKERWLVWEALDDPSGQEHYEPRDLIPGYAFTPDSRALVAAYGGKIHRIDIATGRATIVPFVANIKRQLGVLAVNQFTLPDTTAPIQSVLQPALSPDGQQVAFSALDRIWIMELPRGGQPARRPRRLTGASMGEFYPAWSPDSRWIAYTTWRDGEGGAVWRADVRLGEGEAPATPERLTTDTALYFHSAVAPDGKRVVVARIDLPPDRALLHGMGDPHGPVEPSLTWVPFEGGAPSIIATLPSAFGVSLRDLVRQVYFTTDLNPEQIHVGLSSWGWDGSKRDPAFTVRNWNGVVYPEPEPWFLDGVMAPDRRHAILSVGNRLYDVSLPPGLEALKGVDTLDLVQSEKHPFGGAELAAREWGDALRPWVSWSRNGRRVAFAQGRALYVGDVPSAGWITFQRVEVPLTITPDIPRGTIAFRGARLVTMRDGEVIEHGDIVVRDNRIALVGLSGRVAIPAGARVIDARGMTILPGYVDIHEHAARSRGIHLEQSWRSLLTLAYGVTAVRDPFSGRDNDDFAYADRARAGDFLSPRIFSTGLPYLGPYPQIVTLEDAREAVRRHAEDFRTETFKVYTDVSTDRRTRQLLAIAARQAGLNITVHNNGGDHVLASLVDGLTGIEHHPGVRIYDDVATLIARSGVTYTHTYLGALWGSMAYITRRYGMPLDYRKIRRFVPPSARWATCGGCDGGEFAAYAPLELDNLLPIVGGAARIAARGGQVGMGSHGNIVGIGFHYEMWLHGLGGMPNHDILRSATIVGATAIGHAKDFGSLEPGKLADLQVLDHNPLTDIQHTTSIRLVMKNGRLYEAENLTEIWPRRRSLPSVYFWEDRSSAGSANDPRGGGVHPSAIRN